MRLIGTLKDEKAAQGFSQALTDRGIENQCEITSVTDWGNPEYRDRICRIWVTEEDRLEQALDLFQTFQENPQAPEFKHPIGLAEEALRPTLETLSGVKQRLERVQRTAAAMQPQPMGPVTLYMILLCCLLYFWGAILPSETQDVPGKFLNTSIIATSPVNKALLYDYPAAYELLDKFATLAREGKWTEDQAITAEGQQLLDQFAEMPYWKGFYHILVKYLRKENWRALLYAPTFEKISQGEGWRIVSPAFLHHDLLHILFNMLWLLILGKQMEERVGTWRYVLFCLLVGAFSNTAQYLMAGANFLGFSGILCGMLAYIWVRQSRAPWEGYQLQPGTFTFLTIFVVAMLGIQSFSFFSEVYWNGGIAAGIANTAHLSGALMGYLLGKTRYFAWRSATIT